MEITWLGASALLLKGRQTKVLVDPDYRAPSGKGNPPGEIVVSAQAASNQFRPSSGPQVVARAGEYELAGVAVRGVPLGDGLAFVTELDEVSVCDFGELSASLDEDALEALGGLDVLAVSLGQGSPERARQVAALISQLQPGVMVPVGYQPGSDGGLGELAPFAQEMGLTQITPQSKLNLSGSGGGADDTRVVVLEARR